MMTSYLPYIIFGGLAAFVVLIAVLRIISSHKLRKYGIEADAVISGSTMNVSTDNDGRSATDYTYYVTYTTQDGQTVQAVLDREPPVTRTGTHVRIKYLPQKPRNAVLIR